MQIDWLTVTAQWINFLVLMWLLRRYLYQPIVRAMDKRQQTLAACALAAEQKMQQAEQQAERYRNKLAELEAYRSERMAEARQAANTEREELAKQSRGEFEALAQQWRQDLEREKAEFQLQFQRELGRLVTTTARKAVVDLTGRELEQALFDHFISRLEALSVKDKQLMSESGRESTVLASSSKLDESTRTRFADALNRTLPSPVKVSFEALPDSSLGLMLTTPAYTLEWRVEGYFTELQTELNNALNPAHRQSC